MSGDRRSAEVLIPNLRLRAARDRLDLTQEEMGQRLSTTVWELHQRVVSITGGMVSKWERGERRPQKLYREAYRTLCKASDEELGLVKRRQALTAAALGTVVTLTPSMAPATASLRLAGRRARPGGKTADGLYAPEVAAAIRRAMLTGTASTGPREPDLQRLTQRVLQAWHLRQGARYVALGTALPSLIIDSETAVQELSGDEHGQACRLLTHTYNAASSVLKRLGDFELASIAADRAVRAARPLDDALLSASALYRLANVLLAAGRPGETKDVAVGAASLLEPGLGAAPVQLAVWGGLLLTAAIAAASQGATAEAWELLGEAATAAHQLGADYADLHTIFGPTNVAIHGVQVAAELGDGREVLRRAVSVKADRLPAPLVERRTHFLIDVARGHAQQADDSAAVATLVEADRQAPEEVRFNPVVRDLVSVLLRRERRGAAPGLRELAASVARVP